MKEGGLIGKNVNIGNHRTSIRLEPTMWDALVEISKREHVSFHEICTRVHERKPTHISLTAAVRVFIVKYFHMAATEKGHAAANHGQLREEYQAIIKKHEHMDLSKIVNETTGE